MRAKTRFFLIVPLFIVAIALLLAPSASPAQAQAPESAAQGTFRGLLPVEHFDVSPPLTELALMKSSIGTLTITDELPSGLEGPLGPQDADGALQSTLGGEIPSPIVSFDGQPNVSNVSPPDPVGDVGPNHYVAMSNLHTQIFTKAGVSVLGPVPTNQFWAGFGGACQNENAGDPVVIHDQFSNRWFLMQFTSAGPQYFLCVAVSSTPDPTGAYFRYAFSTGGAFPDYPKMGIWSDSLLLSTREFTGSSFTGVGAYAVNRAQLIAGNPAPQVISFVVAPGATPYTIGDGLLPADIDGNNLPPAGSPAYYMGSMDNGGPYGAPQDALNLWKFVINYTTPASSSFTLTNTIPIAAYDTIPAFCAGRSCVPQPGTTNRIDHLGYRQRPMHRLAYRNYGTHESMVTNQSVEASATMSGIRWWEVRSPNAAPVVFQEGTYAPGLQDGTHRWMGSIAMDASGNMGLGYSASSTTVFPSVWYTGRLAGDPLGTMPQGEASIITGTGSQTGSQRWGDYTSMNIDPVDDCTFWYVNEYVPTTSSVGWRLRIGAFKFPNCSAGPTPTPTATVTGTPPTSTPTATATPPATATATVTPPPAGTYCSSAPLPIVDGGSTSQTITVPDAGALTDLNVSINASHTWVGDLIFTLAHGATSVTIIDRPGVPASTFGCSGDDINATLDDEAAAPVENQCAAGVPTINGSFTPNNPLSAFDGMDRAGAWTMTVQDAATPDGGTVNQWCLVFTPGGTGPTATATTVPPTATTVPPTATTVPPTATMPPTSIELGGFDSASNGSYAGWLLGLAGLALIAAGMIARRR